MTFIIILMEDWKKECLKMKICLLTGHIEDYKSGMDSKKD